MVCSIRPWGLLDPLECSSFRDIVACALGSAFDYGRIALGWMGLDTRRSGGGSGTGLTVRVGVLHRTAHRILYSHRQDWIVHGFIVNINLQLESFVTLIPSPAGA